MYKIGTGTQCKKRTIEDKLSRKSGHGLSHPGSTRDFKYWKAVSLGVRHSGEDIPGVEIDPELPRLHYLQKAYIVPAPVSSSVALLFSMSCQVSCSPGSFDGSPLPKCL